MGKFASAIRRQDTAILLGLTTQPMSLSALARRYSPKRSRKAIAMSIGRLRAAGFSIVSETHYTLQGADDLKDILRRMKETK